MALIPYCYPSLYTIKEAHDILFNDVKKNYTRFALQLIEELKIVVSAQITKACKQPLLIFCCPNR